MVTTTPTTTLTASLSKLAMDPSTSKKQGLGKSQAFTFRQKANKRSLKKIPIFYKKVLTNKKSYVIIIIEKNKGEIHMIKRGEIYYADLSPIKGSERAVFVLA
jgi:hypothetical protein